MTKKQPRSAAQIAASRANGSQSKGPKTEAGKAAASHNRVSHGFRASHVCLQNEDATAYEDHLAAYITRYAPIDKPETDLVGLLASSMWQIMRNNSIEVALFDIEISNLGDEIRRTYENMDEYGRIALAFKKANGDNALELLRRYRSTSERAYHRALQALEQIQKDRPSTGTAAAATTSQPRPPEKEKDAVRTQTPPPEAPGTRLRLVPNNTAMPAENDAHPASETTDSHSDHPPLSTGTQQCGDPSDPIGPLNG
jgi:hypothetical protein